MALAEYNYILEDYDKAQKLANEAITELEKTQDKISQLRAQDLAEIIKNNKNNKNKSKN